MVTPTYGTAMFKGVTSGKTYAVDMYISDVVGAPVTFDSGNGATSTSLGFWRAPEPVILYDLSIATGPTVMTALVPTTNGGIIAGFAFRIANFLNTLATRPAITIGWKEGSNVGFNQR